MSDSMQYIIKWKPASSQLFLDFQQFRASGAFTDLHIECQGRTMKAHKIILSTTSSFFKTLLQEDPSIARVEILGIGVTSVQNFLDLTYLGEVQIDLNNVVGFMNILKLLRCDGYSPNNSPPSKASNKARGPSTSSYILIPNSVSNLGLLCEAVNDVENNNAKASDSDKYLYLQDPDLAPTSEERKRILRAKRCKKYHDNMKSAAGRGGNDVSKSLILNFTPNDIQVIEKY